MLCNRITFVGNSHTMEHDYLAQQLELSYTLTGVYDTPDTSLFSNVEAPSHCLFAHFQRWQQGQYTLITPSAPGCRGAGRWLCSEVAMPHAKFLEFLARTEGLKESEEKMDAWLGGVQSYKPRHGNIVIGPLADHSREHLLSVTFWVNPDQLSALLIGAQYHSGAEEVVMAPFGSGCGQLLPLFPNLDEPRAMVAATDIAMRQHLPADVLGFTVTPPMYDRLCSLGADSFLGKPFFKRMKESRKSL